MNTITQLVKGELYRVNFDNQEILTSYKHKRNGGWRKPTYHYFESVRGGLSIRLVDGQLSAVRPVEPELKASIVACTEKLQALRAAHDREFGIFCDRCARVEDEVMIEFASKLTTARTPVNHEDHDLFGVFTGRRA